MLKLFVRDNTDGHVHEYGTNPHDSLLLMDDGSLHYENLKCCVGTQFPEEGYSFCREDGTIPQTDEVYGGEPYIDIAGCYHEEKRRNKKTNGDRFRAMSDREIAEFLADKFVEIACMQLNGEYHKLTEIEKEAVKSNVCHDLIYWLRHPSEV